MLAAGCTHAGQTGDAAATGVPAFAPPAASPRAIRPQAAPSVPARETAVAPIVTPVAAATRSAVPVRATSSPVQSPAIYSVSALPGVAHAGEAVVWDVRTSRDIVSVSARTSAITLPLQRLSAGHFGLTFAIPRGVPGFFHGTYDFDVSAVSAAGTTLHRDLALSFQ